MTLRQLTALTIMAITMGYAIVFLAHNGIKFMITVHTVAQQ